MEIYLSRLYQISGHAEEGKQQEKQVKQNHYRIPHPQEQQSKLNCYVSDALSTATIFIILCF
jgi:hypothetical protein